MKIQVIKSCYGEKIVYDDQITNIEALDELIIAYTNYLKSIDIESAIKEIISLIGYYESTGRCDQCGDYGSITTVEILNHKIIPNSDIE